MSFSFFDKALTCLWGICAAGLLFLLLFFHHVNYAAKSAFYSQWLLLFLGLGLVLLIYFLLLRIRPAFPVKTFVLISGIFFMCLQLIMVFAYYFQTGWDSGAIIYLSKELALGLPLEAYSLSQYPNNSLMTVFYSLFYRAVLNFGLSEQFAYRSILAFQCFLSFATAQLCFHAARLITGDERSSLLAYVLCQLLLGLSPWVSIPYSDSLALPFPILLLTLYLWRPRKNRCLLLALLGFAAYIGYQLKPTVMIVFIAVCIYELFDTLRAKRVLPLLKKLLPCALGLAVGMLVYSGIISSAGIYIDKEQSFGAAHFLNMGLNEQSMGVYTEEDVQFSLSFSTAKERTEANLAMARARLDEMGMGGLARHLARKLLCTYNDGTFAWGREGFFVVRLHEAPDSVFSPLIRSFYHGDGQYNRLLLNFEHALWLAVLALSCLAMFSRRDRNFSVPALSLMGLLVYFMLFEVRARYVYIYAPLYILMAVLGLHALSSRIRCRHC